jgi:hypothetical protein
MQVIPFTRPVSGLLSFDLPPSREKFTVASWQIRTRYRCGGSTGIAPVSRFSERQNITASGTLRGVF